MSDSKRRKVLAVCVVGIVVCMLVIAGLLENRHINLADYVVFEYSGCNGYAEVACSVDKDKLYQDLAANEKNMEKLKMYKKFADSVTAQTAQSDVKNGDKIYVAVDCDYETAELAGLKIGNKNFSKRASGISEGTKVDLFENVEVIFAGISPEAYVVVKNNWNEDYLNTLEFKADKTGGIVSGDVIKISCSATQQDLAKKGYVAERFEADYKAARLSAYVDSGDKVDKELLKNMDGELAAAIGTLTDDKTFRMLYKATGDEKYLHQLNDEKAENINLENIVFLKRKENVSGGMDNYIYFMYSADVSNSSESLKLYFVFEFSQGYVTVEGQFNILRDEIDKRYRCSRDEDAIYEELIGSKLETYNIQNLTK